MTLAEDLPIEVEPGLAAPDGGPRVLAPLGRRSCVVAGNEQVGRYAVFSLEDQDGPEPLPGQFYMLAAEQAWGEGGERPYLGRAFSFCRTRAVTRDFLVDAIGPATARLAKLAPGERAWVVGPLGIGFSSPGELGGCGRALLVGGGVGIAPLVAWSESLAAAHQ